MKRIAILSVSALRNTVMISVYTDYLLRNKDIYQYDYIYLDKFHEEEKTGAQTNYRYEYDSTSVLGKIKGYLGFIRYGTSILKKNKYDYIIVWNELSAALFMNVLVSHYRGRYCINIRDLFEGKQAFLDNRLFKAIKNASYVSVPTTDYYERLPQNYRHYIQFHSFNDSFMSKTKRREYNTNVERIRILYIGNIRFFDYLYDLIDKIKNDSRYELLIAGGGSEPLNDWIKKHNVTNVIVKGKFQKEDTPSYLEQADVIYNLYGDEDFNLRTALSNKLYYALYLHLPILVCKNTAMYRITNECGIGYPVIKGVNDGFADDFYEWFNNLDRNAIALKCDEMILQAKNSQIKLIEELEKSMSLSGR